MKERIKLFFSFSPEDWPRAQAVFRAVGRPDLAVTPLVEPFLGRCHYTLTFEDHMAPQRFRDTASRHGFRDNVFIRWDRIYTDSELSTAPLLRLIVRRAPKGEGGPSFGTTYDLSPACRRCGTGAIQETPLVLERSAIRLPESRAIFETLDGEILVRLRFGHTLMSMGVTGLELRPVLAKVDKAPLPWLQMIPSHTLPPMAASTRGIVREGQCPTCARDGFFNTTLEPEQIRYCSPQVRIDLLPDVVQTWECFGNSALRDPFEKSHFAHPLILVKPKFLQIVREQKVRAVEFRPVEVTDCTNTSDHNQHHNINLR